MLALSIIIPSYNCESTIEQCLNSCMKQTFDSFEIIIVDGASADNTLAIIKECARSDSRIKIISEQDSGVYDAMNKGITYAKGAWLYFLGSDDSLIREDTLDTIFSNKEIREFDVVYGNVISTRFDGRYDGEFSIEKILKKNICHQAIFFKKSIFNVTGNFDLKYSAHADYDHNLKWFLNSKLKKKYLSVDIANYADGGYSSVNGDPVFAIEKKSNFLKYSLKSEKKGEIIEIALNELKANLRKKRFKQSLLPALVLLKQVLYA